ncbi:Sporulation related domain-containing protein [Desulfatibacillum alkenivorans DSM 16219]|jgi:cell division septation protein DedD|uniref:Sporulation related domain-containing protein n=1 Tax=Desulfatibacillum alkenivorans DSM 16219 TaxID=1121393 RepID=A0A1M6RGX8_9BACT|nr:SPOR domain-containing protein [Desulfatibacillum alkenivorans]SHK31693.1 Sporulation related domain-containing protein [Desulfatibacillum alkenivorans DSM 16219]
MAKAKTRDRDFRFTRKEFFVFVLFVFASMAAMFTLGIYVGRGQSPMTFDIEAMQKELAGLKAAVIRAEKAQAEALEKELARKSEYDFFQQVKNPSADYSFPQEENITPESDDSSGTPVHLRANKRPENVQEAAPLQAAKQSQPPPAPAVPAQPAASQPAAGEESYDFWTVQVAAVLHQQDGARMVDKFLKMGYPAYMLEAHPEPGRTIYRVRMGHFKSRKEAEALTRRLSKDWNDYLIVKK